MNLSQDLKCFLLVYFGTLGDGYSLKGSKISLRGTVFITKQFFWLSTKKINESCGKWRGAFLGGEAWRNVGSKCHSQNFVNLWLLSVDLKNLFITGFQDKSGTCSFILALFSFFFYKKPVIEMFLFMFSLLYIHLRIVHLGLQYYTFLKLQ